VCTSVGVKDTLRREKIGVFSNSIGQEVSDQHTHTHTHSLTHKVGMGGVIKDKLEGKKYFFMKKLEDKSRKPKI